MKKFLFTLASIALGFAAYANTEAVAFSANEITLEGGQTQELTLSVVDKPYALVNGVQYNFTMFDENGAILNNGCHLELLEAYGTRDAWAWFGLDMVQANGAAVANGTNATSSNGTYHQTDTWDDEGDYMPDNDYGVEGVNVTYTGKYNVILANVASNQIYTTRFQYPMQVLKFTVKVDEGWEGNYATFRLVMREYSYSDGVVDRIENEEGIIVLKINNGSAVTPPVAPEAPVVTFVENGDVLTVTVTAEDDVVLTVNGVEVDSPYSYTVNRTYATQTINVTAVATRGELSATTDTAYVMQPLNKKPVADPVIAVSGMDDDYVYVTVTWPAETDGEHHYSGQDKYPRGPEDYSVTVTAWVGEGTEWLASNEVTFVVEVPNNYKVYNTPAPEVGTNLTDDALVITATGEGTVTLYVTVYDNETGAPATYTVEGNGSASYSVPRGDEDVTISYWASATADVQGYDEVNAGTTQAVYDTVPAKPVVVVPDLTGDIVFSAVNQENGRFTVTYTGNEAVTITLNNETITLVRETVNTYQLPAYGTYNVTATAKAAGYNDKSKEATLVWNAPVSVIGEPTFTGYTIDGIFGYGVYIFPSNPADADIMYCVYVWDTYANDWALLVGWEEYTGVEGEIYYTDEGGKYRVEAYAYVGDEKSETISYEFVVQTPVPTGIDEMMNGKTIAGVRYFNMAGQEMQEANGMTIVVTTYTDGTTSAVKVMK